MDEICIGSVLVLVGEGGGGGAGASARITRRTTVVSLPNLSFAVTVMTL